MEIQDSDGVKYVVNLPPGMSSEHARVAVMNTENGPVTVIFMDETQDASGGGEINLSGTDALHDILSTPGVEVSVMEGEPTQDSTSQNVVQNTTHETIVQDVESQNFVQSTAHQAIVDNALSQNLSQEGVSQSFVQHSNVDTMQTIQNETTMQTVQNETTMQTVQNETTMQTVQNEATMQTVQNETTGLVYTSVDQGDGHQLYALSDNTYGGGNVSSLVSTSESTYVDNNPLKDISVPQFLEMPSALNGLMNNGSTKLENAITTGCDKSEHNDILGQALLSASLNSSLVHSNLSENVNETKGVEESVSGQNLQSVLTTTVDKYSQYKKEATSGLKFRCTLCAESFDKMNLLLKHRADDHAIKTVLENTELMNQNAKQSEKTKDDGQFVNGIGNEQERVIQVNKDIGKESVLLNEKKATITQKRMILSKKTSSRKQSLRKMKPVNKADHSNGFKVVLRSSLKEKQLETFSFRKNEFCNVNHAVHEACLKSKSPDERLLKMGPKYAFFKCFYCHQCFTDRAEIKSHVNVHRTVCSECGLKCSDLARLRRHRLNVHKSTKDGVYGCLYCKKKFGNKPDLMAHLKVHVGPWICERADCGVQFRERKYLVQHRKSFGHGNSNKGKTGGKIVKHKGVTTENIDEFIEQKSSFKDTDCGRVWAPARCKICREQFTRMSTVRKHLKMVHMDPEAMKLQCDKCDYKTQFGYVLERHKKVHNKQYKCDICTKTFDYESTLNNHLASHAKARFQCYYCSKRFITREECVEHLTSVHIDQRTKSTEKSEKDTNTGEPKIDDKKSVDTADKASNDGKKPFDDTDLAAKRENKNKDLGHSKSTNTVKQPVNKTNTASSSKKPNKMECNIELNQQAVLGTGIDLENVTYIDSHGQSGQDLVVPGNVPEVKPAKPGYRIAPQTIEVPNSDVTLDLLSDGTIITKDKQGTNFSEIKLETLGIDLNSLEGQTNIELVIVQSDGTEVKATIQAVIEKNQQVSPVKAKNLEPTLAALNAVDNDVNNETDNLQESTVNNENTEQNNTGEERLYKCSKCPRTFKYFNTYKCHESVHDRDVTYTCPLCFRVFAKSKNLTTHLELHKSKLGEEKYLSAMKETENSEIRALEKGSIKEFNCDQCNKVFPDKTKLARHIKQCHMPKKFKTCPHCSENCVSKKAYDQHLLTHTSFNCQACGEVFNSDKELFDHLKEKHLVRNPNLSAKEHICPICKIAQGSREKYSKHLRQVHGESDELQRLLDELKVFKCDLCESRFTKSSKLKKHILSHTNKKNYACQHCSEKFDVKKKLLDHYKKEHKEDFKNPCKICMKNFLTKEQLSEHNKKEHSKSFRCKTCEQIFADYDIYCRHIFDEHGEGEACNICNEIFLTRKSMLHHGIQKHAKKTKHACNVCGEEFTKATELRNHEIEEHAEETIWDMENDSVISEPKPMLKCDLCNFEVVDEFLYRQHYLTKHFKGDEEAMLNEYPNLTKKVDSGQSLIICDHCGNDFPGIDELNKHLTSLGLETLTYIDHKEKEITPQKRKDKNQMMKKLSSKKDEPVESEEEFDEVEITEDDEEFMPVKIKKPLGRKALNKNTSSKKNVKSEDQESFLESNFNLGKLDNKGKSPMKSHKCYICGEKFGTEKAMMKHAQVHDDESDFDEQIMKENNIKPIAYKCDLCGNSYATAFGLKTHKRHKHSDSSASKNSKEKQQQSQGKLNTFIGLYKKKLPLTTLKNKNDNNDFTKTENGEYKCQKCSAVYKSFISITHHTKMKHRFKSEEVSKAVAGPGQGVKKKRPLKTPVKTEQLSPARVSTSGRVIKKSFKTIDQMQCEICFKQFAHESSLLKHMVNKHQLNNSSTAAEAKDDDNSSVTDNASGTFCKLCNGSFKNFGSHLYQKHKDLYYESKLKKESPVKDIKEEMPSFPYKSEKSEKKHDTRRLETRKHKAELSSTSIFKFKCKSCPRKFRTENLLKLHNKSHKMKEFLKEANKPKETEIDDEEIDAIKDVVDNKEMSLLLYKCKNCPKSFGTRKILEAHIDRNHATSFNCKNCRKEFENWRALSAHERFHHKDRKTLPKPQPKSPIKGVDKENDSLLICGICSKVFPDQPSMRNHLQSHKANQNKNKSNDKQPKPDKIVNTNQADTGGQVKMTCNICNVSFDNRGSLMEHMMSHTSISNNQVKQNVPLSKRTRLSSETPVQQPVAEKTPTTKDKAVKHSPSLTRAKAADIKMSTNKTNMKKENINIKRKLEEDQSMKSELPLKKKRLDQNDKNVKNDDATTQKKIKEEVPKKKLKQELKQEAPKKVKEEIPKKIKEEVAKKDKEQVPKKVKQEFKKGGMLVNKQMKLEVKKVMQKKKLAVGLFRKKLVVAKKSAVNITKKVSNLEIKCSLCEKIFKHLHAKQVHMINVHKRIAKSVKDKYCNKCKILYKSEQKLKEHDKTTHKAITKKSKDMGSKKQANKQNVEAKKKVNISKDNETFPCSQCSAKFTSDRGLKIHHKKVHSWQTAFAKTGIRQQCLMCLECQKLFKSGSEYKDHLKTFHTMEIVDNGVLKTITSTELEVEIKKEIIDDELVGEKGVLLEQTQPSLTSTYLQCKICNIVVGNDFELSEHVKRFHPEILVNPIEDLSLGTSLVESDLMERDASTLDKDVGQSVKNREVTDSKSTGAQEAPYPVSCVVVDVDTSLFNSPQLFSIPMIKLDRLSTVRKQIIPDEDKLNRSELNVDDNSGVGNDPHQDLSALSDNIHESEPTAQEDGAIDKDNSTNETGLVITNTVSEANVVFNTENINETEKQITTLGNESYEGERVIDNTVDNIAEQYVEMEESTEQKSVDEMNPSPEDISSKDDTNLGITDISSAAVVGANNSVVENIINTLSADYHTEHVRDASHPEQSLVSESDVLVNADNILNDSDNQIDRLSAESKIETIVSGNEIVDPIANEGSEMNILNHGADGEASLNLVNTNEQQNFTQIGDIKASGTIDFHEVNEESVSANITRSNLESQMDVNNVNISNETEKQTVTVVNHTAVESVIPCSADLNHVNEQVVEMNYIAEQGEIETNTEINDNIVETTVYETTDMLAVSEQVVEMNGIVEESIVTEMDVSESMMANTGDVNNVTTNVVGEIEVSEPILSNTNLDRNEVANTHNDITSSDLLSANIEACTDLPNTHHDIKHAVSTHSNDTNNELLNAGNEVNVELSQSEPQMSNTYVINTHTDNTNIEHEDMEVDRDNREIGYLGIKIGLEGRDPEKAEEDL